MKLNIQSNIDDYAHTFARYRQLVRKAPAEVLDHRTGKLLFQLHEGFKRVRPSIANMISAAKARNYRVKRSQNSLTGVTDGLSSQSVKRAKEWLNGRKSEYFRVSEGPDGVPVVKPARVGRNKKRLLGGGRSGRKFAGSAVALSGLESSRRKSLVEQNKDVKILNLRALSVAIELANRARAGRGGLLALQFLHQVYRKRKSNVSKGGGLISRTRDGTPVGRVDFKMTGPDGTLSEVLITGTAPGTAKVDARHGISAAAIAADSADMKVYIDRKLAEARKKAGLK